ncbi:Cation efflux system protein CusF precursor [compost metagenome]
MNNLSKLILTTFFALGALSNTYAQDAHAGHHMPDSSEAIAPSASASAMSEGEIRKVNKDTAKLTIKHGPLENLDMPGMTMVFQVKDLAMLEQVKEGDKVRFIADRVQGAFTVIKLEPVQ